MLPLAVASYNFIFGTSKIEYLKKTVGLLGKDNGVKQVMKRGAGQSFQTISILFFIEQMVTWSVYSYRPNEYTDTQARWGKDKNKEEA